MTAAARSARTVLRQPRKKPARHIRLLSILASGEGILQVTEGKEVDRYFFSPVPAAEGRGFRVEKWAASAEESLNGVTQTYDVRLDGKASTCECKGFLRWGHCRHVERLTALVAAGKLPAAPVPSKPAACPHEHVFQSDGDEIVCADCGAEL